jgi:hypothetical protein
MSKYLFIIAVIVLIIFMRSYKHEKMYGDWQRKSNYPIGQYDPDRAGIEIEREV